MAAAFTAAFLRVLRVERSSRARDWLSQLAIFSIERHATEKRHRCFADFQSQAWRLRPHVVHPKFFPLTSDDRNSRKMFSTWTARLIYLGVGIAVLAITSLSTRRGLEASLKRPIVK